ncbi:MAG: hypothetical protein LBT62_06370 [Deltaproteobacteria bacterium]|jgi:hypothetical protein|nr:hypothetical protein [Deltaproteobacteria bacterium]
MSKILRLVMALLVCLLLTSSVIFAADEEQKPKPRHPSYSLLGHDPPPEDSPLNPNFVTTQESKVIEGTLWHSSYISERLVGLDIGDVTGSNLNEIVYVTLNTVYLSRRNGEILDQLATYDIPLTLKVLSVDLFDSDGDGRDEIFLSCQKEGSGASSIVLAYDGQKKLKVLADFIPFYIRAVLYNNVKTLAVQKSGTTPQSGYGGNVLTASFSGGKIVTSGKIPLPFGVNLYNFTSGKVGSKKTNMTLTVTPPYEHLTVYEGNSTNDFIWGSTENYCSTLNAIDLNASSENSTALEYIPSRILLFDIDKDGNNEVVVARNQQDGITSLKNLRSFNGGVIEALKFSNLSMVSFFNSTNLIPGPAVDYKLADFDNNGTTDLVIGVVIRPGSGSLKKDARSIIVSYSNLYAPPKVQN